MSATSNLNSGTSNKGHSEYKETSPQRTRLCPYLIHFYLWKRTTFLQRTKRLVPKCPLFRGSTLFNNKEWTETGTVLELDWADINFPPNTLFSLCMLVLYIAKGIIHNWTSWAFKLETQSRLSIEFPKVGNWEACTMIEKDSTTHPGEFLIKENFLYMHFSSWLNLEWKYYVATMIGTVLKDSATHPENSFNN